MISESVPSSVADLLSLAIHSLEVMIRTSIPKGYVSALESILSCNMTRIGQLESQLASKSSESHAVAEELD